MKIITLDSLKIFKKNLDKIFQIPKNAVTLDNKNELKKHFEFDGRVMKINGKIINKILPLPYFINNIYLFKYKGRTFASFGRINKPLTLDIYTPKYDIWYDKEFYYDYTYQEDYGWSEIKKTINGYENTTCRLLSAEEIINFGLNKCNLYHEMYTDIENTGFVYYTNKVYVGKVSGSNSQENLQPYVVYGDGKIDKYDFYYQGSTKYAEVVGIIEGVE